jgi:hypothetical protein
MSLFALCCALLLAATHAQVTLVAPNSTWKYYDDASFPGTGWVNNTAMLASWQPA